MNLIAGAASTDDMKAQAKPGHGRISAKRRRKYATVAGDKFPIPPGDKGHAKAALARINQAKPPLTAAQKARVIARARKVLGENATAGDGRLERPAPRYNVNAGGYADAMKQGDAGADLGDKRTYQRKEREIARRAFGARTFRGKGTSNA